MSKSINIGLWLLHCLYAVACVFGPLIASGLNETQKTLQGYLMMSLVAGAVLPPFFYFVIDLRWTALVAPVMLAIAVTLTILMFKAADPAPVSLMIFPGEEKVVRDLTVRFTKVDHESASTGPDEPLETYAVYFFELSSNGKSGSLGLPLETAEAPLHPWEKYNFKLAKVHSDGSVILIVRE